MTRQVLDSLDTCIAVIDSRGVIVATNRAWEDFAAARGASCKTSATVGSNFLELLREGVSCGDVPAGCGVNDVLAVINRERDFTSIEYELAVSGSSRWFVVRAIPLSDSRDSTVISHEDITERILAHAALRDTNNRLQAVSRRMLSIQEEERRSLARELHDDIGQSLTALKIGLHRLESRVPPDNRELLSECLAVADSTLDKLRDLSLRLRPPQLDQLGLHDALGWLVERQQAATGVAIDYQCTGFDERLPPELEIVCYRIVQEAFNNVARHANASQVNLHLDLSHPLLTLTIRDDGVGFDMDATKKKAVKSGSLGLTNMEERAQLVGGTLNIHSAHGEGTAIQVAFVLAKSGIPEIAPDHDALPVQSNNKGGAASAPVTP
ncbi:MAG: histidine kinase [Betaproteobacteria bacterium]